MWHCVDEVAERNESGGKTDSWAIEGCDQDFRMGIKGVGNVKVVRDKVS